MASIDLRPMSSGEILDRSFQIYRAHFGTMFLTAVVTLMPVGLFYAAADYPQTAMNSAGAIALVVGGFVVMMLLTAVAWGALAWEAHQAVSGGDVDIGSGLRRGLRALFAVLFLGVLAYILLLVAMIPPGAVGAIGFGAVSAVAEGGILVGLMVLVGIVTAVLGVTMLVWWVALATLSFPVLIVEEKWPFGAINRALTLGKGARVQVTALMIVVWLIVFLPTMGALFALGLGQTLYDPVAVNTLSTGQLYLQQIVTFGVNALTTPFMVTVTVMLYYDRRIRREGYDVELSSEALTSEP